MIDTREFLTKLRRRATGSVLGHAEHAAWYARLTSSEKAEFRDKVLSAFGTYHDAVLDVVATLDGGGGIHNEEALALLQQLHETLVPPRRERPLQSADGRG